MLGSDVFVGGNFTLSASDGTAFNIARWNGSAWYRLPGAAFLGKLESLLGSADRQSANQDDAAHEARAMITAELSVFRGRYVDGYTLLRAPPERLSRLGPSLLLHAVGGFIASLMLALLITLALRWRQVIA